MFCLSIYFISIATILKIVSALTNLSSSSKPEENVSIVGGYNASITDHPYQVSLSYQQDFVCGGSIISESYILTAETCSYIFKVPDDITARAGSASRLNGTVIPIAEIIFHPKNDLSLDFDVLLLKTVKEIEFNDVIQAISLPAVNTPLQDNSLVTVTGWGLLKENDSENPSQLMAVKIPVVNFYDCWKVYDAKLSRNMWCGGYFKSGGKGPCNGDSGGPAVQNGVLFGIVSWSYGCAEPGHPVVFTDVAAPAIREFIANHTYL